MDRRRLVASALAGASTGGRTFTAFAAVAVATPTDAVAQPDRTLARPAVRAVAGLMALGELVLDKLPQAPSRLEPPGLVGRLLVGGLCGAVLARRAAPPEAEGNVPAGAGIAVGAAAALGTSYAGSAWRGWCGRRTGSDRVGAIAEDLVVLALAAAAVNAAGDASPG